ncbi:MAG: iron-containing alcohol dehydrogenase [Marinobacter sp.]|uniref:iron-containing alcohol dehydrogenase n=1 Tax=Marinobacter sp. TaxID=50741 RepID=UPI00299D2C9A|nr:iron-containing alcohol dehydrogenase [Marinobacter sp.]MDX1634617.1 iron-containing alcohol dehydrogenase [Marinobacter sp.]
MSFPSIEGGATERQEPVAPFNVAALPRIVFGNGTFEQLVPQMLDHGREFLIVTGGHSFLDSSYWPRLKAELESAGAGYGVARISGEPSPGQVDTIVRRYAREGIDCVVGIGGGSALDAGKAIAGLLPNRRPVRDFLEGVGRPHDYRGPALPFLAVPTTAGTGSELTRNAVITETGPDGFKKSFRNDLLLPKLALVDPDMLVTCPPRVMLGNALDAVTQLLESLVSTRASVFTDALARDGLRAFAQGFRPNRDHPVRDHSQLAYAAMISGLCLTQAGLGSVHGFASPLGAFFGIAHGMACGTMLAACTETNIRLLQGRGENHPALAKYAEAYGILTGQDPRAAASDPMALAGLFQQWTDQCELPRLSELGVRAGDLTRLVAASGGNSMKTNPVVLTDRELESILRQRL